MNDEKNMNKILETIQRLKMNNYIDEITTKELGELLKRCDQYLKSISNESVFSIMDMMDTNQADIIMILLLMQPTTSNQEIINLHLEIVNELMQHGKSFYNVLVDLSNKKILNISDETLLLSSLTPESLTINNNNPGEILISKEIFDQANTVSALTQYKEEDLKKIITALKHNMDLYNQLYKDKIWIINTTELDNPYKSTNEKIEISSERFFHLIGLEWKNLKINTLGFSEFSKIFDGSEMTKLRENLSSKKANGGLFEVLELMVKHEERLIQLLLEGRLSNTVNIPKLEMKNFGFERIGLLEHSSGLILFDRNTAKGNEVSRYIKSDLILLNDFIRRYDLSAALTLYHNYQQQLRDSESLIIPRLGLEKSAFFTGQRASVSDSVASFNKHDFNYGISVEGAASGDGAIEYKKFSDEDKLRIINSILEILPNLDKENLIELYHKYGGMNPPSNGKKL